MQKNNIEKCPKVNLESRPDKSVKIHALTINPTEKPHTKPLLALTPDT